MVADRWEVLGQDRLSREPALLIAHDLIDLPSRVDNDHAIDHKRRETSSTSPQVSSGHVRPHRDGSCFSSCDVSDVLGGSSRRCSVQDRGIRVPSLLTILEQQDATVRIVNDHAVVQPRQQWYRRWIRYDCHYRRSRSSRCRCRSYSGGRVGRSYSCGCGRRCSRCRDRCSCSSSRAALGVLEVDHQDDHDDHEHYSTDRQGRDVHHGELKEVYWEDDGHKFKNNGTQPLLRSLKRS